MIFLALLNMFISVNKIKTLKMKIKLLFSICTLFLLSNITVAQVGIGTSSPKGILDIDSSIYGVVYPSAALTSTIIAAPVLNTQIGDGLAVGTTIYNTNETFTGINDVEPGIYSWDREERKPRGKSRRDD